MTYVTLIIEVKCMKCDICGSEDTFVRDCKYTFSIQGKEVTIISEQ